MTPALCVCWRAGRALRSAPAPAPTQTRHCPRQEPWTATFQCLSSCGREQGGEKTPPVSRERGLAGVSVAPAPGTPRQHHRRLHSWRHRFVPEPRVVWGFLRLAPLLGGVGGGHAWSHRGRRHQQPDPPGAQGAPPRGRPCGWACCWLRTACCGWHASRLVWADPPPPPGPPGCVVRRAQAPRPSPRGGPQTRTPVLGPD